MQLLFYLFSHKKSVAVIHEFSFYVPVILRYSSTAATLTFRIQADELALDLKHEVPEASRWVRSDSPHNNRLPLFVSTQYKRAAIVTDHSPSLYPSLKSLAAHF
jgi:hypothetical protein